MCETQWSDESDLVRFAAALGMASFQAQSLEHSLVSLFAATYIKARGAWEPRVRELMDTRYSQTLGKLIRDAVKELDVPEELAVELEKALQMRNWVTHHFFREYGVVGVSSSLLKEATQRLEDMWPMFDKTANKVHRLVIDRQVQAGRSEGQIQDGIERALTAYLSEREHIRVAGRV